MPGEKDYNDALKLAQKLEANALMKMPTASKNYMFVDSDVAAQIAESGKNLHTQLREGIGKNLIGYEGKVIVVGNGDDNNAMMEAIKRVSEGAKLHLVPMGNPGIGHAYMVPPHEPFSDTDARKHILANLTETIDGRIIDIMGINEMHGNHDIKNNTEKVDDESWEEPEPKIRHRKIGLAGTMGLIHAMGMMDFGMSTKNTMRQQYLDMNDIPESLATETPVYDEHKGYIPLRKKKRGNNLANQHIIDESLKSYHTIASKQPSGTQQFDYPDGFKCFARDQKNADRKHNNYLKENTNK